MFVTRDGTGARSRSRPSRTSQENSTPSMDSRPMVLPPTAITSLKIWYGREPASRLARCRLS
jgi:hypothetical protein